MSIDLNTITCGDATLLLKELDDNSVDITFTSPPYNRKRNDKYDFYNDDISDFYEFLTNITDELLRVTKRYVIINIQKTYYNKVDVFKYIGKYASEILDIVIWEKSNPRPAQGDNITNAYEFFIILGNELLKSNSTYTKNHITTPVNSKMIDEHKAIMRTDVCKWFIENFTNENEIILDPFMGSGTTAIVCKSFNRNYIGFDISEEYCELAKSRLNNSYNKRTKKINKLF